MLGIEDEIIKSEALIQWMDKRIDGLRISSDERTRISAACLDIALEHQKAIVLMVSHHLVGSAFSLVRLLFEAYVRGIWLGRCATVKELKDYEKNIVKKNFATLIEEIEKHDGFEEGVLSKAKVVGWKAMNSYTHSGFYQSVRRNKEESIEPNYDDDEVIEVLGFANSIGLLSALQLALMAGDEDLAHDLLERSKTDLVKPAY